MVYTVQGRDGRGRWKGSRTFLKIYQSLEEAIAMAKDLDEHGETARVVSFTTSNDAYRGKDATVAWTSR